MANASGARQVTMGVRVYTFEAEAYRFEARRAGMTLSMWMKRILRSTLPDGWEEALAQEKSRDGRYKHNKGRWDDAEEQTRETPGDYEVVSEGRFDEEGLEAGVQEEAGKEADTVADAKQGSEDNLEGGALARMAEDSCDELLAGGNLGRDAKSVEGDRVHAADRSERPLTYSRDELCLRCQKLGVSCTACRDKTRGRRPE